jgi:hypothetical protein
VVSRNELAAVLYQRESTPYERSLDVHISHLRKKAGARRPRPDPHGARRGLLFRGVAGGGGMRTVFAKILLWSFGTLVISLGAYLFISTGMASRISGKGGPFERTVAFQVDEAEVTYRSGGPAALDAYLRKLQTYFGPEHFFTDAQGKDLVTGADRSAFLAIRTGRT